MGRQRVGAGSGGVCSSRRRGTCTDTGQARRARLQNQEHIIAPARPASPGGARGGPAPSVHPSSPAAAHCTAHAQDKERPARPEELVRLYDTLLANVAELNELAAEVRRRRSFLGFLGALFLPVECSRGWRLAVEVHGAREEAWDSGGCRRGQCVSALRFSALSPLWPAVGGGAA